MKCKVCGVEEVTPEDPICDSCLAIMVKQKYGKNGFKIYSLNNINLSKKPNSNFFFLFFKI